MLKQTLLSFRLALSSLCVFATLSTMSVSSADPAVAFANCNPGFWPGCIGNPSLCIPTTAMCCNDQGIYCPDGSVCYYPPGYIICCRGGYYGTVDGRCLPIGSKGNAALARGQQSTQQGDAPIDAIPPMKAEKLEE
jgi:hypothetical protein